MADLKSLNELLTVASQVLDTAASEIKDVPLEPTKENISKIGHALSLIADIQIKIYKIDPSLEPEFLKRPPQFPLGVNREFGDILLKATNLCDVGEYKRAISLYEEYISKDPPAFFVKLAKDRISKIIQDYGV